MAKAKKKRDGIVNLQNVHGDPMLKNLLVSDLNWRKILKLTEDEELKKEIAEAVKADREKRKKK